MLYDFDEPVERKNTDSIKYDGALQQGKPEDVLPLWVADMDFRTPPFVIDALVEKSKHGIFGYSENSPDYIEALQYWFLHGYNWHIDPDWLVKTPGVVYAFNAAIRAFTQKGDSVIIQQPVYHPFSGSVLLNQRNLVVNQLIYQNNSYSIDFEDFEDKIIQNRVKLFILCNPHNPVGRVWNIFELTRLGDICVKYGVIVVADEIHADFIFPGYKHYVFANIKPEFEKITITCTAPTKTFNLAGLQISNIIIANPELKKAYKYEIACSGFSHAGIMGIIACQAAYQPAGREWLSALLKYLQGNLDFLRNRLNERMPQIKLVEPEGTYLIWLDCKALNLDTEQLEELIIQKAKLWLIKGTVFGAGGEGFQRVNIACPKAILEKAMNQLEEAING